MQYAPNVYFHAYTIMAYFFLFYAGYNINSINEIHRHEINILIVFILISFGHTDQGNDRNNVYILIACRYMSEIIINNHITNESRTN